MKKFLQFIGESFSVVAKAARSNNVFSFWFNPKTNKALVIQGSASTGPWHVTVVARNPEYFGTTKEEILKYIEKYDRNRNYQEDFEEVPEGFLNAIASQLADKSIGIENLMGEMGYFRCVMTHGVVNAHLGSLKFGSVRPTNSQLKSFVEKVSLMDSVNEIQFEGTTALFRTDFEFFIKYGRVPSRTEIGSRMAQFREEVELNEAAAMYKGWIHPRRRQIELWQAMQEPWHTQVVVKNPEKFGYSKEDLLEVMRKSKTVRFSNAEVVYGQLVRGDKDLDWDIETRLVKDGWVKVVADMRMGREREHADIYALDISKARAAMKMLEKEILSLPDVMIIVWTGSDLMQMTRTASIYSEAHYKTFVKMGRVPVTAP